MQFKDITPAEFICGSCSCNCPAVLETETSYVIIGKKLSADALKAVEGRVGDDEYVIEVQKGMIDGLKK
jgi:hypothetical protein